jgi:hypothetical protein
MVALGCSAQAWAANSLSRNRWYSSFISSNDLPSGDPEGLNTHAHRGSPSPENAALKSRSAYVTWLP